MVALAEFILSLLPYKENGASERLLRALAQSIEGLPEYQRPAAIGKALDQLDELPQEHRAPVLKALTQSIRGTATQDQTAAALSKALDKQDRLPTPKLRADYLMTLVELIPLKLKGESRHLPESARAAAFHKAAGKLDQLEPQFRNHVLEGLADRIGGLHESERANGFECGSSETGKRPGGGPLEGVEATVLVTQDTARGREVSRSTPKLQAALRAPASSAGRTDHDPARTQLGGGSACVQRQDQRGQATIKPLYGHQEGAEVGYNPHKPARPSHGKRLAVPS